MHFRFWVCQACIGPSCWAGALLALRATVHRRTAESRPLCLRCGLVRINCRASITGVGRVDPLSARKVDEQPGQPGIRSSADPPSPRGTPSTTSLKRRPASKLRQLDAFGLRQHCDTFHHKTLQITNHRSASFITATHPPSSHSYRVSHCERHWSRGNTSQSLVQPHFRHSSEQFHRANTSSLTARPSVPASHRIKQDFTPDLDTAIRPYTHRQNDRATHEHDGASSLDRSRKRGLSY